MRIVTRTERSDERFRQIVAGMPANECWEWPLYRGNRGYGVFSGHRSFAAHRYSYTLFVGPIPPWHQLDHLCRNPPCVNPAHLEPVTHAENCQRRSAIITHCPSGHAYDEQNTYTNKAGARVCRACHREATRAWRRGRRESVA